MNYYQDSRNSCYMNNKNDDRYYNNEYYYDDYSKNNTKDYYGNDFEKNGYGHDKKRSCCVRRVEETFCCFPSYYNEENRDNKKERCYEGTFKICPKHFDNNYKEDYKYENDKCEYYDEKDNKKEDHRCGCRCQNRCGFCGLFRRW